MNATPTITVLIVEDSQVQAELLRRNLLEAGYTVDIAHNGAEGLTLTRQLRPSIVISDINMPVMDGYAMCEAIRADVSLVNIPVILVTTLSDPGYVLRGLHANADAYLTKPYDITALIAWIGNLLARPPIPTQDRQTMEIWIHGEPCPVQINPQRMMNLLVSIYDNSLLQYKSLQATQCELEELNTSLEDRVIEQTAAVRISERRMHALLLHSEDLVLISDPEGMITFVGPTSERLFGLAPQELIGRTFQELTDPEDQHALAKLYSELRNHPSDPIKFEQRCRKIDGTSFYVDVSIKNVLADPAVGGYVINLRDISLRRVNEEHIRKLTLTVEQSPEMIVIANLAAEIEYVNEAFVINSGFKREEVIGQNASILKSGKNSAEIYRDLWPNLLSGKTWKGEFINKRKDGSEYIASAAISPLRQPNGKITHYLSVQEDVTEKRRMESELAQHRLHLEDLVKSRTVELTEARERAERANLAKSIFLSSMSHEIRTPMNAVIGLAHLLRMKAESPEQIDKLDKISQAGAHLMSVINNILDQSKIDAGKLILDEAPLDLHDITTAVSTMLSGAAAENYTRLEVHIDDIRDVLLGDKTRLTQCLLNLASNAVRHTVGGTVTLRVSSEKNEGNRQFVRFSVIDNGVGIEPELLSKLFVPFEQGAARANTPSSTGLGLVITRRLARLMGGDAGAESTPLIGSTFWFTAWLSKAAKAYDMDAVQNSIVNADTLKLRVAGARILLVDDNPLNLLVCRELLEQAGLVVIEADDGLTALKAMRQADKPFAMILMDMEMPGMGGLEATQHIRSMPNGQQVPIVAITANAFGENRNACIAAGMNDHIAKPVEPETLYAVINKWLCSDSKSPKKSSTAAQPLGVEHIRTVNSTLGFDPTRLSVIAGGKMLAIQRVLTQFITLHEPDLELITSHLSSGNLPAAFQVAHAIKGSAGQIGADELHQLASAVETPLRDAHHPKEDDVHAFCTELSKVLQQVKRWLSDGQETVRMGNASINEFLFKLRYLETLLDSSDSGALLVAEALSNELPTILDSSTVASYESVRSTIRRADFPDAVQQLRTLSLQIEATFN